MPLFAQDAVLEFKNLERSRQMPSVLLTQQIEQKWAAIDFLSTDPVYTLHTADSWDSAYYRQALSHYELAITTHRELKEKQKEYKEHLDFLDMQTPVLWMKADVLDAAARFQRALEQRFLQKLNRHYHDIFTSLSQIRLQENQKKAADLQAIAERHYAVGLLFTGHYAAAADILQKYSRRPGVQNEWPLYYYWHLALGGLFAAARKDRGVSDQDLRRLRKDKNDRLREAVRLKFGEDSPQMQFVAGKIRLDELGSPRS
ncbi:MAG: hypothetical protein HS115_09665 [Spirochaetales bacterium]|nr:hypothetical protein [Spirochaetales bacterium]